MVVVVAVDLATSTMTSICSCRHNAPSLGQFCAPKAAFVRFTTQTWGLQKTEEKGIGLCSEKLT